MPLEEYDRFLDKCDRHSCPEFAILRHAIYSRRSNGDRFIRTMKVECEMRQAERLLALAANLCPSAAPAIESAIAQARN
jgi:hypothetical protein